MLYQWANNLKYFFQKKSVTYSRNEKKFNVCLKIVLHWITKFLSKMTTQFKIFSFRKKRLLRMKKISWLVKNNFHFWVLQIFFPCCKTLILDTDKILSVGFSHCYCVDFNSLLLCGQNTTTEYLYLEKEKR